MAGEWNNWNQYMTDNQITQSQWNSYAPEQKAALAQGFQNLGGMDGYKSPTATTASTGISFGDVASGVQGLAGLANAYTGYKALGLAEDQFNFNKNLATKNYENAAKAYNTNLDNSAEVGLALAGSNVTEAQKQATRDKVKVNQVSTSL